VHGYDDPGVLAVLLGANNRHVLRQRRILTDDLRYHSTGRTKRLM
jgi:hypothetical protein